MIGEVAADRISLSVAVSAAAIIQYFGGSAVEMAVPVLLVLGLLLGFDLGAFLGRWLR